MQLGLRSGRNIPSSGTSLFCILCVEAPSLPPLTATTLGAASSGPTIEWDAEFRFSLSAEHLAKASLRVRVCSSDASTGQARDAGGASLVHCPPWIFTHRLIHDFDCAGTGSILLGAVDGPSGGWYAVQGGGELFIEFAIERADVAGSKVVSPGLQTVSPGRPTPLPSSPTHGTSTTNLCLPSSSKVSKAETPSIPCPRSPVPDSCALNSLSLSLFLSLSLPPLSISPATTQPIRASSGGDSNAGTVAWPEARGEKADGSLTEYGREMIVDVTLGRSFDEYEAGDADECQDYHAGIAQGLASALGNGTEVEVCLGFRVLGNGKQVEVCSLPCQSHFPKPFFISSRPPQQDYRLVSKIHSYIFLLSPGRLKVSGVPPLDSRSRRLR